MLGKPDDETSRCKHRLLFVASSQHPLARCITAISFPFLVETLNKVEGKWRSTPRVNIKLGRSWEGVSEKGEKVGRKGITCTQIPNIYQTPFAHEQGAIVQLYWLVACWSKSDTRNLTFIHLIFILRKTTRSKYIWPSQRKFFKFLFRKIRLKLEKPQSKTCHKSLVSGQDILAIHSISNICGSEGENFKSYCMHSHGPTWLLWLLSSWLLHVCHLLLGLSYFICFTCVFQENFMLCH